jgi:hypothetical protein
MRTATPRPVWHQGKPVPGLKLVAIPQPKSGLARIGRLGAATSTSASAVQGMQVGAAVGGASAAAIGAMTGSVVGPVGTAVGALVGVVVGALTAPNNTASHIGSWDSALVSALNQLPTTVAGIGRQIPWNENSHGLVQMIEALLACGVYMSWDSSIASNYDVCAHWAMTFGTVAQTVATAVCKNPTGAKVTVSITSQPGGPWGPGNFTFTNPGISVGPEAVAGSVIMGPNGAMRYMFSQWSIAGSAAQSAQYASEMGNNMAAQKVFALMVDYVAAQNAPPAAVTPPAPVPNVTQVVANASGTVSQTISTVGTVAAPQPIAQPVTVAVPIAPVATQPAPTAPVATPAAPPINISVSGPTSDGSGGTTQSAPAAAASGISTGTLLLLAGAAGAVYWITKK